jgi:hypothetical protein
MNPLNPEEAERWLAEERAKIEWLPELLELLQQVQLYVTKMGFLREE